MRRHTSLDELGERVEIGHRVAHRPPKREPVRDEAQEDRDRIERDVVANALRGEPLEPLLLVLFELGVGLRDELLEGRVGVDPPGRLELDAEPVGILVHDLLEEGAEAVVEPDLDQAQARLDGELQEDRLLVGEVVEDRAAGEAGDLLESGHRRPLVPVARERLPGALQDLGAALLLVGFRDLRHDHTLQNRTDVLLSRA